MTNLATVTKFQTRVGKAIESFLEEKGKRSKDTETAYRGDITLFLSSVYGKSIDTITAEELELLDYDSFKEFLNSFYNIKSNAAINRYASCIKSMYRELNIHKVIKTDLSMFDLYKAIPNTPDSYEAIPMEVAEQYVEATRFEKFKKEEKKMIIKVAIETGLRLSEILSLKWTQFKLDGDRVYLTGIGKGNKKYTEVVSRVFYNELLEIKADGQTKVFTLTKKNVTDLMSRLKAHLKHENRNYTFHSFKKTAVSNTYKVTGSITDAQQKGKHTNVVTTQLYLEEQETKMTGFYSLEGKINHNLYKEVSHDRLLQALQEMNKELLFSLNLKLQGE